MFSKNFRNWSIYFAVSQKFFFLHLPKLSLLFLVYDHVPHESFRSLVDRTPHGVQEVIDLF